MQQQCRYISRASPITPTSTLRSGNGATADTNSLRGHLAELSPRLVNDWQHIESARSSSALNLMTVTRCFASADETAETPRRSHEHAYAAMSKEDLQIALDVLESLPSPEAERVLAKPHINPFDGWIPLETTGLLAELRSTFASAFRSDSDRGRLVGLALTIFSNTAQRVPHTQIDSVEDWYTLLSGSCLRWETVGLLFSSWALAALQNKEEIDQYRPRILALRFFDMMESCIGFCRGNTADNVLLIYLVYRTSIISSILHGNDSESL